MYKFCQRGGRPARLLDMGGTMRSVYRGLALLICLGVLVQAASIAFGWFDVLKEVEDGMVLDDDYDGNAGHLTHGIVGTTVMPLLALLLLVSSFFTKIKGASKWAGFVLLAVVLQVVMGIASFSLPAIGVLHGVNAFVIFGLALVAARRAQVADVTAAAAPDRDTAAV